MTATPFPVTITLKSPGVYEYGGKADSDGNVEVPSGTTAEITWTPVGFEFGSFNLPIGTPFTNGTWSATSASVTDANSNSGSKTLEYSYNWAPEGSNERPDPKIKNKATPSPLLPPQTITPRERPSADQPSYEKTEQTRATKK